MRQLKIRIRILIGFSIEIRYNYKIIWNLAQGLNIALMLSYVGVLKLNKFIMLLELSIVLRSSIYDITQKLTPKSQFIPALSFFSEEWSPQYSVDDTWIWHLLENQSCTLCEMWSHPKKYLVYCWSIEAKFLWSKCFTSELAGSCF